MTVAVALSVSLGAGSSAASPAAEPAARLTPGAWSYVPLFAQIAGTPPPGDPSALADTLSRYYRQVHGETSDPRKFMLKHYRLGAELLDRGVRVSQYRNGSYTSQASNDSDPVFDEAADLEATDATLLNTFWPGWHSHKLRRPRPGTETAVLTAPLPASATTITFDAVPADPRPSGTPPIWPFRESKGVPGSADISTSTGQYVSWLRVGEEMMKIVAPPTVADGRVSLEVVRGLWNTLPLRHETGEEILAPMYVGGSGGHFHGYPANDTATDELRYSYKFWRPAGYQWLADQILRTLGNGLPAAKGGRLVHYDTVWLDVSSCNQFNVVDAFGNPVVSWDPQAESVMSRETWGKYQQWKLNGRKNRGGGLRDLVRHEDPSRKVYFNGNSFNKFDSPCDDSLMSEYDTASLEHWLKRHGRFKNSMHASFAFQKADRRALYWLKWDSPPLPSSTIDAFQRFGYAAYLMSYNAAAKQPRFGMNWLWSAPPLLFRIDGDPATNGNFGRPRPAASLADVSTGTRKLYRRKFENGRVYLNASDKPATLTFRRPFVQIGLGPLLDGTQVVTEVTIPPMDGAFFRKTR